MAFFRSVSWSDTPPDIEGVEFFVELIDSHLGLTSESSATTMRSERSLDEPTGSP